VKENLEKGAEAPQAVYLTLLQAFP
jgi:hypothetical protein